VGKEIVIGLLPVYNLLLNLSDPNFRLLRFTLIPVGVIQYTHDPNPKIILDISCKYVFNDFSVGISSFITLNVIVPNLFISEGNNRIGLSNLLNSTALYRPFPLVFFKKREEATIK
jgi:hypothetical protein